MQINTAPSPTETGQAKKRWRVYFAGPLFSLNERASNRRLAKAMEAAEPSFHVDLPQDIKYHNTFNDKRFFAEVYKACILGVESADVVVAILDGPSSDDGTCYEVGYAVAKGIPVLGVRTDYRASQENGCNLMLSRGCTAFVHRPAFDENFGALAKDIIRKLKRILAAKTSV
jgi:nucleoside 2-deoxyribosyltransferase